MSHAAAMDIDTESKTTEKAKSGKMRIEKRRRRKSSIVFPKYGERQSTRKKKRS
jgi:hypothetical protein